MKILVYRDEDIWGTITEIEGKAKASDEELQVLVGSLLWNRQGVSTKDFLVELPQRLRGRINAEILA